MGRGFQHRKNTGPNVELVLQGRQERTYRCCGGPPPRPREASSRPEQETRKTWRSGSRAPCWARPPKPRVPKGCTTRRRTSCTRSTRATRHHPQRKRARAPCPPPHAGRRESSLPPAPPHGKPPRPDTAAWPSSTAAGPCFSKLSTVTPCCMRPRKTLLSRSPTPAPGWSCASRLSAVWRPVPRGSSCSPRRPPRAGGGPREVPLGTGIGAERDQAEPGRRLRPHTKNTGHSCAGVRGRAAAARAGGARHASGRSGCGSQGRGSAA